MGGKGSGPVSKGVTAKQQMAYDLRAGGATWQEIGEKMGCVSETCRNHVKGAVRNGLPPLFDSAANGAPHGFPQGGLRPEFAAQRVAEKVVSWAAGRRGGGAEGSVGGEGNEWEGQPVPRAESTSAPRWDQKAFLEFAAAAGVSVKAARALGLRIQGTLGLTEREERRPMTLDERIADATARADWVISHIDPVSIAGMNAKDIAFTWKLLIDGSQLLSNKPTQIVDFNVRRHLAVLVPEMIAEAKRRGLTLEGEFKDISPAVAPAVESAAAPSAQDSGTGGDIERSIGE